MKYSRPRTLLLALAAVIVTRLMVYGGHVGKASARSFKANRKDETTSAAAVYHLQNHRSEDLLRSVAS